MVEQNNNYLFIHEKSLIAFLDLTNMFHWQETLKWNFSIYHVIKQLLSVKSVKEVRIYYGLNEREREKSENFHRRLRECGAIVITKPVKWIKKKVSKRLFASGFAINRFDDHARSKLDELVMHLQNREVEIEDPKCNFDVEMALDMLDNSDRISGVLLFSGDSDFKNPLQRLILKSKKVFIFGVRGQVARELWDVCSKYIDFGKWYSGPKKRKSRS